MSAAQDATYVVVVTGLSGAGKSTALHALEDLGFFCMDNLPTNLAPQAVEVCERGGITRIGLGIDARVGAFLGSVSDTLSQVERNGVRRVTVVFLDANDETILRRFNETRRPHPLAPVDEHIRSREGIAILDGVRAERERLASLRARATRVIDTTRLSSHELRRVMLAGFSGCDGALVRMATRIVSFGFKYGVPTDADLVFDVRFLDNPYFIPELRPLSGLDAVVSKYVLNLKDCSEFIDKVADLLAFCLPKYEREGKSYLTIAIGCTGGQHRSVAIAEALNRRLSPRFKLPISTHHRDIQRTSGTIPPPPPDAAGRGESP